MVTVITAAVKNSCRTYWLALIRTVRKSLKLVSITAQFLLVGLHKAFDTLKHNLIVRKPKAYDLDSNS